MLIIKKKRLVFIVRYIYITDYINARIVQWTTNYTAGSSCIVGCSGTIGSSATQLNAPRDMKFDQYGNLYVCDQVNHRVQKYLIQTSCSSTSM